MKGAAGAAAALALIVSGVAPASGQAMRGRLQGTFTMHGRLTSVQDVYGEHQGQRVSRTWTFLPQCASGSCRRVLLERQRSGRHILNVLMLRRRALGRYVGRGSFWVPLRCEGHLVRHGGRATETITIRVTGTTMVGTTRFATTIRATYQNPSRENLTRCPGGIGHDAATYRGHLASPLPEPPSASFTPSPNPGTSSTTFTDDPMPAPAGRRSWPRDGSRTAATPDEHR